MECAPFSLRQFLKITPWAKIVLFEYEMGKNQIQSIQTTRRGRNVELPWQVIPSPEYPAKQSQ